MFHKLLKTVGFFSICALFMTAAPMVSRADEMTPASQASTSMIVRVESEFVDIYEEADSESSIIGQASKGSTYEIREIVDGAWAKVVMNDNEGYIRTADATIAEKMEEVAVDTSEMKRQEIATFGLQFVGGRYVWGGVDPNKGVDCSGFTRYVLKHTAGVNLSHSSRAQANEGRAISAEEMRPGDIICYANGKRINHVALYIGDGQVVHASNEKEGIKVSPWNYRKVATIVNVLGD